MSGAGRSERRGQARNKLVCLQKRLRAADHINLFFFPCRGCCCLIFKNIVKLIQNVLKSINSWVLKKVRWVHPQCTKHAMVLSKVIIIFEKRMNPHTNVTHKVMPFKRTFFCWQQTALLLRNRHDGNWWCRFETNVHSARNAPYRFQTLCWLSATAMRRCACGCALRNRQVCWVLHQLLLNLRVFWS
jgi:hypothetical protein